MSVTISIVKCKIKRWRAFKGIICNDLQFYLHKKGCKILNLKFYVKSSGQFYMKSVENFNTDIGKYRGNSLKVSEKKLRNFKRI